MALHGWTAALDGNLDQSLHLDTDNNTEKAIAEIYKLNNPLKKFIKMSLASNVIFGIIIPVWTPPYDCSNKIISFFYD